jgi:hypothetical protein
LVFGVIPFQKDQNKTSAEYGEYCGLDFRSGKVVKFGPDVVS